MRKQRKPWPDRFWEKVDKTPGHGPQGNCWLWIASVDTSGYGHIKSPKNAQLLRATHVIWELTYGKKPESHFLCHTCDNPPCVNPAHLFEGNRSINALDMTQKGRRFAPPVNSRQRGERHYQAKLTDADVRHIRSIYVPAIQGARYAKCSQRLLAKQYGVSKNTIQSIIEGRTWRHVI